MGIRKFKIEGPGFFKATDEAIKNKKVLAISYDYDKYGNILRIGYSLLSPGVKDTKENSIHWFNKSEITIIPTTDTNQEQLNAHLDIGFVHPKNNERHFMLGLPHTGEEQILLRCIFRNYQDDEVDFVIQAEIKETINKSIESKPIIRYDFSHGFFHRDMLYSDGSKRKIELENNTKEGAIRFSIQEIQSQLGTWLSELGYDKIESHILTNERVRDEFKKVEDIMISLLTNPYELEKLKQSKLSIYKY